MTPTPTESSGSDPRRRRRLSLQQRIVIAVVLVALVSSGGAAWFAVTVTTSAFRARLQAQLLGSAAAVSRGGLALNTSILQRLSDIIDAQIITLASDGAVLASSVDAPTREVVAAAQRASASHRPGDAASAVTVADCGFPCMVAVREVEGRPGVFVALLAETSSLDSATSSVARAILLSAVLSVGVLVLIMQLVVRRLTVPLERLLQFVRGLTPAESHPRAAVGDDEVGELSDAFNGMLDRLERAQALAVKSEKLGLAGLFAARVAHDVRNPLSSIKLQTQLLLAKGTGDVDDGDTLRGVLRDIEQVESVVRDLMEIARPGELRREPTSLNEVILEALQHLAAQFSYRKIDVDLQLAEGLPALPLDRVRFKQALLNVLVNGSEAMHTGGRMTVSSGRDGGATQWVRICDDGVGIPSDMLDRVFEPFVSGKREGVGLGLVNVKAVVEGHGGHIVLEPRQPRGTCAHIVLPESSNG